MLNIMLTLVVVGVLLWLINEYVPMDGKIKKILNVATVVLVVLWLLKVSGILGRIDSIRF